MIILTSNESVRATFFREMALRNESAALKAATFKQLFRYSRMQYRYERMYYRELIGVANKLGRDAQSLVMRSMAEAQKKYQRYDRLHQEVCRGHVC